MSNFLSTVFKKICDRFTRRKDGEKSTEPRVYVCGTLRYTTSGLFMVFFWLLWGDFTMCLMETILPRILPLQLNALGASNTVLSLFVVTVPSTMNFLINPIVSFRSDRHRGPWGRRIPFLLLPTPFIAAALVSIAYAPEIGSWVHGFMASEAGIAKNTVIITVIGFLLVIFQFFNMFISSVYYYLFNDVVPAAYLSRFMAMFRLVGGVVGIIFNYFIFPQAQTHLQIIFLGAAVLYLVGFASMCFGIKEGEYPPPPPLAGNRKGIWASIETYFRECFTHPFYLNIFAYGALRQISGVLAFAATLFYLHLNISLEQQGKFYAWIAIPSLFIMVPLGVLCDRVHPIRVILWVYILFPVMEVVAFFGMHDFKSMVIVSLFMWPLNQFLAAANTPLLFLLLPKNRFGQFSSADAMARSITTIIGSLLGGVFLDVMRRIYNGNEEYYRWMFIWTGVFQVFAFFFAWRIYQGWKSHGGFANYKAPEVIVPTQAVEPTKTEAAVGN